MSDPAPYNVTISSQTASIQYAPVRDGDASQGWNVTYDQGSKDTGYGNPQGVGIDSHQTNYSGATMSISWVGTAVYLYGQASAASYSIDVDGASIPFAAVNVEQGGLLGSRTGLQYGNHTVTLTTSGTAYVAFQYAELTIGIGYVG